MSILFILPFSLSSKLYSHYYYLNISLFIFTLIHHYTIYHILLFNHLNSNSIIFLYIIIHNYIYCISYIIHIKLHHFTFYFMFIQHYFINYNTFLNFHYFISFYCSLISLSYTIYYMPNIFTFNYLISILY